MINVIEVTLSYFNLDPGVYGRLIIFKLSEITIYVICTMCNICSAYYVLPEALRYISYVHHTTSLF